MANIHSVTVNSGGTLSPDIKGGVLEYSPILTEGSVVNGMLNGQRVYKSTIELDNGAGGTCYWYASYWDNGGGFRYFISTVPGAYGTAGRWWSSVTGAAGLVGAFNFSAPATGACTVTATTYDLEWTASATGTCTPKLTFTTETITAYVNDVQWQDAFISGTEKTGTGGGTQDRIDVTEGDNILYVSDGNFSHVTQVDFTDDKISGSANQFTGFSALTTLILSGCSSSTGALSTLTALPITNLNLYNCSSWTGALSALTGKLFTTLNLSGCSLFTGDLSSLVYTSLGTASFVDCTLLTYSSSGQSLQDCDASLEKIDLDGCTSLTAAMVDNVLIDLAASTASAKALDIKTSVPAPTIAGLVALYALQLDGWTVTVTSPTVIPISTLEELQAIDAIPSNAGGVYTLQNNIDASGTGSGFNPIGDDITPFTGEFNGNNKLITGLFIDRAVTDYVGLFGEAHGSTIYTVGLPDCDITGNNSVGALIGLATGCDIDKCWSSGVIEGHGSYFAGGLIGNSETSTIDDSYSHADVVSTDELSEGIAGLIGTTNTDVLTNCYSTGAVSGGSVMGGLVAADTGAASTFNNCFWDTETSGQATSAGGTGKTTAQMKKQSTFTGWDFSKTWGTFGYPMLSVFKKKPFIRRDGLHNNRIGQSIKRLN